jgi:LemA protein
MFVGEIFWTAVIGFALVGTIGYVLSIYNGLVALRNNISRSWSNIDVLLKQRHDELPKLVKTCEGYMRHERGVFDKLSEARAALAEAKSVAEAYPDLKANQSFIQLQNRISELENQIADRRELYNDTVTTFNTRIQQIPDRFVADLLTCVPAELFQVEAEDRRDVEINFQAA